VSQTDFKLSEATQGDSERYLPEEDRNHVPTWKHTHALAHTLEVVPYTHPAGNACGKVWPPPIRWEEVSETLLAAPSSHLCTTLFQNELITCRTIPNGFNICLHLEPQTDEDSVMTTPAYARGEHPFTSARLSSKLIFETPILRTLAGTTCLLLCHLTDLLGVPRCLVVIGISMPLSVLQL